MKEVRYWKCDVCGKIFKSYDACFFHKVITHCQHCDCNHPSVDIMTTEKYICRQDPVCNFLECKLANKNKEEKKNMKRVEVTVSLVVPDGDYDSVSEVVTNTLNAGELFLKHKGLEHATGFEVVDQQEVREESGECVCCGSTDVKMTFDGTLYEDYHCNHCGRDWSITKD